jgi:hypothetical protein
MLVLKLESWPKGDPKLAREEGRIEIVTMTEDGNYADFLFTVEETKGHKKLGRIHQFPCSRGVWWLLLRVLKASLDLPDED